MERVIKTIKHAETNTKIVSAVWNLQQLKNGLIKYNCFCYGKNYQKVFHENIKKEFTNTCRFSKYDVNKFVLLLQKGVYLHEYMSDWKNLNEDQKQHYHKMKMLQPPKHGKYYDADYTHTKIVCEDFKIKKLRKHFYLYVQCDTLLLANVFKKFEISFLKHMN